MHGWQDREMVDARRRRLRRGIPHATGKILKTALRDRIQSYRFPNAAAWAKGCHPFPCGRGWRTRLNPEIIIRRSDSRFQPAEEHPRRPGHLAGSRRSWQMLFAIALSTRVSG